MAKALSGIRQKLSRTAEMVKGVQRLHASGIVDFGPSGATTTHRGTRLAR